MISEDFSQKKGIKKEQNTYYSNKRIKEYRIIEYFFFNVVNRPCLSTTAGFVDEVKKTPTDLCNNKFCSGAFLWEGKDIYHFVNYNMPLSQEFIDYVLDQYKQGKFTIN